MNPRPGAPLFRHLGDVLREEQERALGRRAVRAGLLSEEDLELFFRERRDGGPRTLEEFLRARGAAPDQIARLKRELDRDEYLLFRSSRLTPPEVEALQDEPDRRLAEFVLVQHLGQGGIGDVWKAWDTRLGRWVAIKLPRPTPDQEAASRRFSREALAAARLSHPNIVAIHRVAEEAGRCFIVMQYVEGRTLAAARPPLREALEILRDVARAVHYAHEQGVVHRDLKPGNILIARDGRPFVLDFGLAHLEEAAGAASREGFVAGTAAYMSPEQARGGPASRARPTDIYSLGATLYEAVTGRPPFEGGSFAEILQNVLHQDPPPPRRLRPELPRDVETVILKAMEKDPARRYASALEMAEDLERCLRREPVAARRPSALRVWASRIRRSPRLVAALAAGGLLASAAGFWEARRVARRDHERAIRETWRASLAPVLALRRAGANERMADLLPALESSYRQASQSAPDLPEIDYVMGRIYRTLLDEARAREFQERALAKDPSYAPALYEGLVLAALARDRAGVESWAERLREILSTRPDALDEARVRAARGLAAFFRAEEALARENLRRAVELDPGLEEAWEALARSWLLGVTCFSPPGDQEEACQMSEETFGRAIAHDRGYAPHWAGRGEVRTFRGRLKSETGRDPQADFQGAEDDFAQALRLAPSAATYRARAELRRRAGLHRMELGGNPLQDFAEAEADLEQAARRDPGPEAHVPARAFVAAGRARFRQERGESALEEIEARRGELQGLVSREPCPPEAWKAWAILAFHRALDSAAAAGPDARELEEAFQAFAEALRRLPADRELRERRAALFLERARRKREAGRDACEDLAAADRETSAALEGGVFFNRARVTRAAILRQWGLRDAASRRDPSPRFAAARSELSEVLEANPLFTEAWVERGNLEADWGRRKLEAGDRAPAREHFTQAIRCYEEALRLNPFLPGGLRAPLREARRSLLATY
ncbi:MAG TPA: protein kinase [Planctomycetota bacterium]|nr:protein kinase [Planctomycetota bacterium]